jgi:hypothetical protein
MPCGRFVVRKFQIKSGENKSLKISADHEFLPQLQARRNNEATF